MNFYESLETDGLEFYENFPANINQSIVQKYIAEIAESLEKQMQYFPDNNNQSIAQKYITDMSESLEKQMQYFRKKGWCNLYMNCILFSSQKMVDQYFLSSDDNIQSFFKDIFNDMPMNFDGRLLNKVYEKIGLALVIENYVKFLKHNWCYFQPPELKKIIQCSPNFWYPTEDQKFLQVANLFCFQGKILKGLIKSILVPIEITPDEEIVELHTTLDLQKKFESLCCLTFRPNVISDIIEILKKSLTKPFFLRFGEELIKITNITNYKNTPVEKSNLNIFMDHKKGEIQVSFYRKNGFEEREIDCCICREQSYCVAVECTTCKQNFHYQCISPILLRKEIYKCPHCRSVNMLGYQKYEYTFHQVVR